MSDEKLIKTPDYEKLLERNENLRVRINDLENLELEYESALRELAHERELLHSLMDNIPDTIYFKDSECRFTKINNAQVRVLGLKSAEEAIGKTDFAFFNKEHSEAAFEDEQALMKSGKPVIAKTEKIRCGDGEYRWFSATKVPIKNKEGKCVGMVGISRDITEKVLSDEKIKDYTEQLKHLNSTKDRLFSIIAHDLKNPFTSLLGATKFLSVEIESLALEDIKAFAENINKSAGSVYTLLENLLQWSRLQTDSIKFKPGNMNICELTAQIINLYKDNAKSKNISIHNRINDGYTAYADSDLLSAALRNLLSNAIKFTNPGGEITIDAIRRDNCIEASIEDNGIGISESLADKLFRIDENASTLGTNKEKGTGLGLILCKEFIELNGGKLWFTSEHNKGTKFTFSVPVEAAEN